MKYNNVYSGDDCAKTCSPLSQETQYDKNLNQIYYQLDLYDTLLTTLGDKLYKVLYPDYPQQEANCGDVVKSLNSPLVDTLENIYLRQGALSTRLGNLIDRIQL